MCVLHAWVFCKQLHTWCPQEARLWVTVWLLGSKPSSSEGAVRALAPWAISPDLPSTYFWILAKLKSSESSCRTWTLVDDMARLSWFSDSSTCVILTQEAGVWGERNDARRHYFYFLFSFAMNLKQLFKKSPLFQTQSKLIYRIPLL